MSYFDNANNKVTRKSFGSKVDKEFKREGVIPVKDRSKDKVDKIAESAAKYQELNSKVNARRLNDLKEQKAFETKIQEGYKMVKDELIKDFISEICVESLLVDEDVVVENLKNIVEMVERQVDDLGGFEGVKHIAESTNNPILLSMVRVCEDTAKKVGERNVKEGKVDKNKVNFGLEKIELEEYDYRKKEMGSETIVNNIKEKVFQVVQDEQKLSSDKQMVMDDIQNKVSELEAPVEEAMKFIFERPGIEEDTLFNSMMRSHYKQIMESNSSAIFESFDYKELQEPVFEDHEFTMKDIELIDEEIDNEEIVDMFINEANNISGDNFEEGLENLFNIVQEGSQFIYSKSQATHYKGIVRKLQDVLENMEVNEIEHVETKEAEPQVESAVEQVRRKLLENEDPVGDDKTLEKEMKAFDKGNKKEVTEEVIVCPKCGKEECSCKVAKESCIMKLENICEAMNVVIEAHENARNNVIDSLNSDINGENVLVPYLQTKDVNLNNLEFAYKTKMVCESLKDDLKHIEYLEEANVLNKAIELNIKSIDETLEVIKENESMNYKASILCKGKGYLERVQEALTKREYESNEVKAETVFNTPEAVEKIFSQVREYYVIESTDKELMELVMAEAIVEYTILETFNTLNLINFTKDSVRQIARKNITK